MAFKNVRILYSSLCPGHQETLQLTLQAVDSLDLEAAIEQIDIETDEDAAKHRFLGSPTVQIEGKDVEPDAQKRTDYGMGVRYYKGGVNHPPMSLLQQALSAIDVDSVGPLAERHLNGIEHLDQFS